VTLFAATGAGIAELLPGLRSIPLARRLAYAYLFGIGWIAGGLYVLSHLFAVPLGRPAVLVLAAPPLLAGLVSALRRRPRERSAPLRPAPRSRLLRAALPLAVAVAATVSLAVLGEALAHPVAVRDWDGRMTWVAQARFVRAAGTVDAPVLRDARWFVTHPRYPLLLPLAQIAVLDLAGGDDRAAFFRPLYAAFLPVFLLLVYDGARRWAGRQAAALTLLAAALIPYFGFSPEGGAVTAYSDLPLACFYGAGLLLLLRPRLSLSQGLAAGLLLGAAVLAKREGAPLALAALGLGLLPSYRSWKSRGGRRRVWNRLAPVGLATLLAGSALALLISWAAAIPQRYDEAYENLVRTRSFWPAIVTRLPLLLSVFRHRMLALWWGLFWWVAPFLFLIGRRGLLRRRAALPFALATAIPLGIGWAAYTISDDPVPLASTTWNRFLMQAAIPGFVLLSLVLRELLRAWRPPRKPAIG
jgi:hypothetical protein